MEYNPPSSNEIEANLARADRAKKAVRAQRIADLFGIVRDLFAAVGRVIPLAAGIVCGAYGGHLWTLTQMQAVELAAYRAIQAQTVIDCAAARAVAECVQAYPGSKCEVVR